MKELLAQYADGYMQLSEAVKGLSEEELNFKPAPEKWSVKEIALHVCDTEVVAVHRMKQVISEKHPLMIAFDQDAWAERQQYANRNLQLHLELLGLLRESMLDVLGNLTVDDWHRFGIHNEVGKVTLYELVQKFTGHVTQHIEQIRSVREVYRNRENPVG